MARAIRTLAVLLLLSCAAGCTVGNTLDVCERRGGDEVQANVRTEGHQHIRGHGSVSALPGGAAFFAFTSSLAGQSEVAAEVRGGILTPDGTPLRTCDADGEGAFTHVAFDPLRPVRRSLVAVGTPTREGGTGILVYAEGTDPQGDFQIFALPFAASTGCPLSTEGLDVPFPVSESGPEWTTLVPSIATVGRDDAGNDRYVIVWWEGRWVTAITREWRARARTVTVGGWGHDWEMSVDAPDGGPATLRGIPQPNALSATAVDDERFAVLVYRADVSTIDVSLHVYDLAHRELGTHALRTRAPMLQAIPPACAVASNGDRVLAVWTERDAAERHRVVASLIDPDLGPVTVPLALGGEPFRVGSTDTGEELFPSVAASADGGFVVAWNELNALGHLDTTGSGIRTAAFSAEGQRRFVNPACDATDFQMNQSHAGEQTRPALATLVDGTILAIWNDDGAGIDLSEGGLRARSFEPRELLPLP